MSSLKRREVYTILLEALIIGGFWLGLVAATGTTAPLYAIVSESMVPTINKWDLIVIQNVDPATLVVGDIIVFHSPWNYDELIVHRIVGIINSGSELGFITKGDNNPSPDRWGPVPEGYVRGKVAFSVAYLGFLPHFLRSYIGIALMATLLVALILMEFTGREETSQAETGRKEAQVTPETTKP